MTGVAASEPLLIAMTDARTGDAHWVTYDAVTTGRRAGSYVAVCEAVVLAASLTTPEQGHCRFCARWWAGR